MKKLMGILLAMALLLCLPVGRARAEEPEDWTSHYDEGFYSRLLGEYDSSYGSMESALEVNSAAELAALSYFTNEDPTRNFQGKYISLKQEIDLSGYNWVPICPPTLAEDGDYVSGGFSGTFCGNSKTILNMAIISSEGRCSGFFGAIDSGVVQDVSISGSLSGNWNIGGICGIQPGGTIRNCHSAVNISGAGFCLGGIAGQGNSQIIGCSSAGTVLGTNENTGNIGGIVGWLGGSGAIKECYNTGAVSGGFRVGGIAGRLMSSAAINRCENSGHVAGNNGVGGIVGQIDSDSARVSLCLNRGTVENDGEVQYGTAGGIAGANSGTICLCANKGEGVYGSNGAVRAGGIAGFNRGYISDCLNLAAVYSIRDNGKTEESCAGGIVAYNYKPNGIAVVRRCANSGSIRTAECVGGIVGFSTSYGMISDCYSDGECRDGTYVGGITGCNNSTMKTCAQFGCQELFGETWTAIAEYDNVSFPTDSNLGHDFLQFPGFDFDAVWQLTDAGKLLLRGIRAANLYEAASVADLRSPKFEFGRLTLRDESGNALNSIPSRGFWVTVPITKYAETGNAQILLAAYDNSGKFLQVFMADVADLNQGQTIRLSFYINNGSNVARVKAFAISSFGDLTPLGASAEFPAR